MGTHLPTPRYGTSAVRATTFVDGRFAYVFGGVDDNGNYLNQIVRYDITSDDYVVCSALLPTARAFTAAIWDESGSYAYIFGGQEQDGSGTDDIWR